MLTIGEFSSICRVSTKTLRYYAEIGLILPEEINPENGYRYYSINQLETMLFINRLKAYHFSLEEIKAILESEEAMDDKLYAALSKKKKEISMQMMMYKNMLEQIDADMFAIRKGKSIMSYILQKNVEAVIRQEDKTSLEGIETKLLELQKELLKLANSKKDYNSVADEIDRLRELKQNALVESAEREGLKQRIREMREFLEQQSTEVTEYDELLVRRLIEKVTVYDERFEVEFKSGAKVDMER